MRTSTCSHPEITAAAATFAYLHAESVLLELLGEAAASVDGEAHDLGDLLEIDVVAGRGRTWAELWAATGPAGVAEAYVIAQLAMAGDVAALEALIGTLQPVAGILDSPTCLVPDAVYALAVQAWSSWTADAVTGFDADELLDLGADRVDLARWLAAARDRGPWTATEALALHIAGIAD